MKDFCPTQFSGSNNDSTGVHPNLNLWQWNDGSECYKSHFLTCFVSFIRLAFPSVKKQKFPSFFCVDIFVERQQLHFLPTHSRCVGLFCMLLSQPQMIPILNPGISSCLWMCGGSLFLLGLPYNEWLWDLIVSQSQVQFIVPLGWRVRFIVAA